MKAAALLLAATLALAGLAAAQTGGFLINLREAPVQQLAEDVSAITGRTIVLDPAARGSVTVLSGAPLDADGVWELFQAALRAQGLIAVQAGAVWRVAPAAGAVQGGGGFRGEGRGGQDLVTQLLPLRTLRAETAARALRALASPLGTIEALERPNALVVTDVAEGVARMERLARELDGRRGAQIATVRLRFAAAADVAQTIDRLLGDTAAGGSGLGLRAAADERSNTVVLSGDAWGVEDARALIADLDVRDNAAAPVTRVFPLRNTDVEPVAEILRGLLGGGPAPDNPVARSLAPRPASDRAAPQSPLARLGLSAGGGAAEPAAAPPPASAAAGPVAAGDIALQASTELNAIVARGPQAALVELGELVGQLDRRRAQVQIEAAIVEISGDAAETLGVQLGVGDAARSGGLAATSFSGVGPSLQAILAALGVPGARVLAPEGGTIGVGVGEFSILVQALAQSNEANLLSTPSLTTLDNQEAEIVVGQNVPFITGTFSPDGGANTPFTTIERRDVGVTLRVLPRIYQGDMIRLEIMQEASSLVESTVNGASDLITNRRAITTTVLADDGGTVVLGGLIADDRLSSESKVPVLGDIPVVGQLFRTDREQGRRQTLFVFLRPTILRDREAVAAAAQGRYERLRAAEAAPRRGSLLLEPPAPRLKAEIDGIY